VQFISDFLLGIGALAAAAYCLVLSRRLQNFTRLESGMGNAIAVLSAQVDDMTRALEKAQAAAKASVATLESMTGRGEIVAQKLELLLASMHDIPEPKAPNPPVDHAEAARKLRFVRSRPPRDEMEAAE